MFKKLKRIGASVALTGIGLLALTFVTVLPANINIPIVTSLADKMIHNTSDRTGEKRTKGFGLTDSFPKLLYSDS